MRCSPPCGYKCAAWCPETIRRRQLVADGLYRCDSARHAVVPIGSQDVRALTGMQDFVATAPLDLVHVSDLAQVAGEEPEDKLVFAGSHAGFVSQNVYLFCAAAGLSTVVRASIDKPKLAEAVQLRSDQQIILSTRRSRGAIDILSAGSAAGRAANGRWHEALTSEGYEHRARSWRRERSGIA